ncbi:MAG TPA: metallophosphoesterase [Candidatus Hydrogenedentes bacterium]|nr:metallophosphoesterase [Candidatus Hydrogenedentota bacterium]
MSRGKKRAFIGRIVWGVAGLVFWTGIAYARGGDGALALIQTPNNGIPAIAAPGQTFEAILTGRADLRIMNGTQEFPLTAAYTDLPGGRVQAKCSVPPDAPEGAYQLAAANGGITDQNNRSVFVRKTYPEVYPIAHVSDAHIGRNEAAANALRAILQALNQSDALFVALTGDLTDNGTPEQFTAFVEILDTCTLPTFVCPGNHDRAADHYERFFGPLTYAFQFGQDGYLSFDTKDYCPADELGSQDGALERYRRLLKPCRWTIGLTHRYDPMMGMRSQIILFVDNPLDVLLFGHWHRENKEDEKVVPWGNTRLSVVPAAVDGVYRILDVTVKGLLPRPVQTVQAPAP